MVLVEVLISSFLMVALLMIILGSFVQGIQFHAQYDASNELTQLGTTAASRICGELADVNRQSIHWDTSPPGIVFATPRGADGAYLYDSATGKLLWRRYVCYYVDVGRQRLIRKEEAIASPPVVAPSIPANRYSSYFTSSALRETWTCSCVDSLEATAAALVPSPALTGITLRLSNRPLGSGRVNRLEVATSTLPRN